MAAELNRARVWWDVEFSRQLALMSACDLLISPHTGFAFLASCLGTPWLTLSCCRWPEYLFNETPFHSILPHCSTYPSLSDDTDCTRGQGHERCLTDLIYRADEVADAAEWLIGPEATYEQSVARHLTLVDQHPRRERFAFFDGRESLLGRRVRAQEVT